jgi:hypothetical protein
VGKVKGEPGMDRETTRVTSRGSGHTVYLGQDKRFRISSTGVRQRRRGAHGGRKRESTGQSGISGCMRFHRARCFAD